ncbi:MAG TPA: methionyl-tRNA formyltransferase [Candidatus Elarobacter sp.]|nr:methionyl-tRNA formyltransferase [Candidatus Elarobacter sp.]
MKLVVFGTSEFAVPVLEALAARHDVVGVVTQPDRPAGRGQKVVATPVKRAAEARGLRVLTPEKLKPFVDDARALGGEAFVVASYGKIVPQVLLDAVPIAFNVHPSWLPLYRGATPLQSAIRDGRTQTGVTIIAMDAGMDTGDVLLQEPTPIGATETYGELHDRLARRGAEMALDAVVRYANGRLTRTAQAAVAHQLGIDDDEIERTRTRPLGKDGLLIPSGLSAKRTVDFVRSLARSPGARSRDGFFLYGRAKILCAHVDPGGPLIPAAMADPGRIIAVEGRLWIEATDGVVAVDELIVPGGKPVTAEQYRAGNRDRTGPAELLPVLLGYHGVAR